MEYPPSPSTPGLKKELDHHALNVIAKGPSETSFKHSLPDSPSMKPEEPAFRKDLSFWMIMLSLSVGLFMSATDLTGTSTALPSIANDLKSQDFTWIVSSYTLASTCTQPVFGGFAQSFGRKPILLASIAFFAAGSAVCGSASAMTQMIVGRTVQGCGGGGILALTEIVVADLVPLSERGVFLGLISLVWAFSAAIGPILGAVFAASNWRWLFYMNLPIAGIALILVTVCMHLRSPALTLAQKLRRLDWPGIILFMIASTALIIGLTWGGADYDWDSPAVLAPLIGGSVFLAFFFYYEKAHAHYPIVPYQILSDRTCLASYLTSMLQGIAAVVLIYYLPSWFIAVKGRTAIDSAIDIFPLAFLIAPAAVFAGILVKKTQRYRVLGIVAWAITTAGAGMLVLLRADSSMAMSHGLQAPMAIGVGLLFSVIKFSTVAPLPPALNAQAMSFFTFSRAFGNVLGITIGSVTMTNELKTRLPSEYLANLPSVSAAFSDIPNIAHLSEPIRTQVRIAFSDAIRVIWMVMIGIGAAGLLVSLFIRALPLGTVTDEDWGIVRKEDRRASSREV